ncbi:MAG: PKD domain-containing protein [Thermoplasmata archaeon]
MALIVSVVALPYSTGAETIHSIHNAGSESTDYLYAMTTDSEGNVYLGGALSVSEYRYVAYLAKFNRNGSLEWDRTLSFGDSSAVFDIAISPTGEVYALCDSDIEMFLVKLTSTGGSIWTKGLTLLVASYQVELVYDGFTGGVVALGSSMYTASVEAFDADGNVVWATKPDDYLHEPCALVTDGSGNTFVLVHHWDTMDIGISKLDKNGRLAAAIVLDTPSVDDWGGDIEFTSDGGLVCTGVAQYANTMLVSKVGSNLKGRWGSYVESPEGYFEGDRIATCSNGTIYVLAPGTSYVSSSLNLLFQFDLNGNILRVANWPEPGFMPQDLALLPSGGVVIAGNMRGLPQTMMTDFTNYATTPVPANSWIKATDSWSRVSEISTDIDVVIVDPDYPIDVFDERLQEQLFYCVIEPSSPLKVDIYEEFVAKGDTLVNLTATISGGAPPYSYTWSFGDGSYAYDTDFVAHRYPRPGIFYAQVYVEDSLGNAKSSSTIVLVYGPPSVSEISYTPIPGYLPLIEGIPLSLSVIAEDPDGGQLTYLWDFGDGNSTLNTTGNVIHAFQLQGNYTVGLMVIDDEGDSSSTSVNITIGENIPPSTYVYYWPRYPHPGQSIEFGQYSSDPDDWVESYFWDFGDDTTGSGYYTYHAYAHEGTYNVTLTVKDTGGKTGSYSVTVVVMENWPPQPDFWILPAEPSANATTTFDAHQSWDPDGSIVAFDWDFGDGITDSGWFVSHTYRMGGFYNVTLTVTDNQGASAGLTIMIYVNFDPVAVLTFEPSDPLQRETITLDGSCSYDSDGTIVRCIWSLGGGCVWETPDLVVNFSFWDGGDFLVNLTVIDDKGGRNTTSRWIHVSWIPIADAGPDQVVIAGQEVTFNGSGSSGNGEIVSYRWEFVLDGQLIILNGSSPSFTFLAPGVYEITFTVTDEKGFSATDQVTVVVMEAIPEFSLPMMTVILLVLILAELVYSQKGRRREVS